MYQDENWGWSEKKSCKTGTNEEAASTDLSSSGESVFFSTTRSGCAALKSASSTNDMCRTMPNPFVSIANLSA